MYVPSYLAMAKVRSVASKRRQRKKQKLRKKHKGERMLGYLASLP